MHRATLACCQVPCRRFHEIHVSCLHMPACACLAKLFAALATKAVCVPYATSCACHVCERWRAVCCVLDMFSLLQLVTTCTFIVPLRVSALS
jgi:hypothetical protein